MGATHTQASPPKNVGGWVPRTSLSTPVGSSVRDMLQSSVFVHRQNFFVVRIEYCVDSDKQGKKLKGWQEVKRLISKNIDVLSKGLSSEKETCSERTRFFPDERAFARNVDSFWDQLRQLSTFWLFCALEYEWRAALASFYCFCHLAPHVLFKHRSDSNEIARQHRLTQDLFVLRS